MWSDVKKLYSMGNWKGYAKDKIIIIIEIELFDYYFCFNEIPELSFTFDYKEIFLRKQCRHYFVVY